MIRIQLRESNLKKVLDALESVLSYVFMIAAPTETVYGLMTLYDNEAGRDRICRLKGRDFSKPLQVLAADWRDAVSATEEIVQTVEGSVGVRVPDHGFLLHAIGRVGCPFAATSANRSGEPPALTASDAVAGLTGRPDLLVDAGPVTGGVASTVVRLDSGCLEILREGPVDVERLRSCIARDGSERN